MKQGAVREALEDTCQEHGGGAGNCIRYGKDRTKYRTVPSLQIPTSRTVPDTEKPHAYHDSYRTCLRIVYTQRLENVE